METLNLVLIIIGGLIVFVLFWLFVVWLIALVSGWPRLAEAYPGRAPWNPTCWSMQSALLRSRSQYRGVVRVCADHENLHLSVLSPFALANKPISVPWPEISGRKRTRWFYYGVELRFERTPDIPINIRRKLADQLVEAAGGAWRYEAQRPVQDAIPNWKPAVLQAFVINYDRVYWRCGHI